jgi:hypothetical protein
MEYLVNHTKKSIRAINGVSIDTVRAFVRKQGWNRKDNYEIIGIATDEDACYLDILLLIEEYGYEIPEDEHPTFVIAQELAGADYDAASIEGYEPSMEVMWGEMDGEICD